MIVVSQRYIVGLGARKAKDAGSISAGGSSIENSNPVTLESPELSTELIDSEVLYWGMKHEFEVY